MSGPPPATPDRIAERAQELYQAGQSARPQWSTLGDTTRGVWREYAERELAGLALWWVAPQPSRT